jgi:hypothetical protein
MDPFGNDEIARLLRLKRYEHRRRVTMKISCRSSVGGSATNCFVNRCGVSAFERAHGFALRHNVRPYPAGVVVVVACAAVISIRILSRSSSNGNHSTISHC